jgi:hypothetical protein
MQIEMNRLLMGELGDDPRVVASLPDCAIKDAQKVIMQRLKWAQKHFEEKLDPMYDPRSDRANKIAGDANSKRA